MAIQRILNPSVGGSPVQSGDGTNKSRHRVLDGENLPIIVRLQPPGKEYIVTSQPFHFSDPASTIQLVPVGGGSGTITVSPSTLPPATIGQLYQILFQATGGTPPYYWTMEKGSIPSARDLLFLRQGNDLLLEGIPTQTGTDSFTLSVADSAEPTINGALLPRGTRPARPSLSDRPQTIITVGPGGQHPTFANAFANAVRPCTIRAIRSGSSFGPIPAISGSTVPGSGLLWIEGSDADLIGDPSIRVAPTANASHLTPINISTHNTNGLRLHSEVTGGTPARDLVVRGFLFDVTIPSGSSEIFDIIQMEGWASPRSTQISQWPQNISIFQNVINGGNDNGTRKSRSGISVCVVDCYIGENYIYNISKNGSDAKGISGFGGRRVNVYNNLIEADCENILWGGVNYFDDWELEPTDWWVERNHFYKRPSWLTTFKGIMVIKNWIEWKIGKRMWVFGNLFENHIADAQNGPGHHMKAVAGPQGQPIAQLRDIVFERNAMRNTDRVLSILSSSVDVGQGSRRLVFKDLLAYNILDANPYANLSGGASRIANTILHTQDIGNVTLSDIFIDGLTMVTEPGHTGPFGVQWFLDNTGGRPIRNMRLTNYIGNEHTNSGSGQPAMFNASASTDGGIPLNPNYFDQDPAYAPVFGGWMLPSISSRAGWSHIPEVHYLADEAAIDYEDVSSNNYRLAPTSPGYNKGVFGRQHIGADIDAIEALLGPAPTYPNVASSEVPA